MRKVFLVALLLFPCVVKAQISGAGQLACNGATITGTAATSATSNNTVLASVASTPAYAIQVQLDQTSTITGGAVTFQVSYDGGANYISVPVAQVLNPSTGAQLTNPYTLVASTNQAFLVVLAGASNFQLKLTTVITGTATITPYTTPLCTQPTVGPLTLDASGNLLVKINAGSLAANQSVNVAQVAGTTTDTNSGNKSAGTQRIVIATDQPTPTNPFNQQGTLGDNGAAASTNRLGTLPCIYRTDYHGGTAATTGRDGAPDCGDDGLLHATILPDMSIKRYRASSKFAASSTTDNWRISGNGSNTVIVTRLYVTCTQTTAGILNMELRKESSAVSGGTAATVTNLPVDSNKAAASSVVQSFTGTGPTVGTLVADIDNQQIGCLAGSTAAGDDIFLPLTAPGAPIAILRGTAEGLALNLGGAVTGGNLTVTVEWQEVTTITP